MRLFWLGMVLASALAGYLVSSGLGERLLHDEIESQLSRLLGSPVEIGAVDLRWQDGLRVEARNVSAFPGPAESGPPLLRARRIFVWVDSVALWVGRLTLRRIVLEGPHVRLIRTVDGSFFGLGLPPTQSPAENQPDTSAALERFLSQITSLEEKTARAVDRVELADRLEVVDGTLEWTDAGHPNPNATPLRVELLNGIAERHWLSEDVTVEWRGVFLDGRHAPFPFELDVHRKQDEPFSWSLALAQIPLEVARTSMGQVAEQVQDAQGTLDVRLELQTDDQDRPRLRVAGRVDDARFQLPRSRTRLAYDRLEFDAECVVEQSAIRIDTARLLARGLNLRVRGSLDRPLRPSARLHIESRIENIDLEALHDYARTLEDQSETALTMARLTDRVEAGHLRYVQVAGTARLDRWQAMLSGEMGELPAGFMLAGAFEGVRVASGPEERIEELAGEVEWLDDQVVLRNGRGRFRGEPLPALNAVVHGLSHLARAPEAERRIRQAPPALPGLTPFFEILRPRDPDSLPPLKAVGMAMDHLEHPVFRWPFRDLRVLLEPLRSGIEVTVRSGTWGGAGISGEVVWFSDPEAPSVSATLTLAPPPPVEDPAADAQRRKEARARNRWADGRFEMSFRPRPSLPFERATGVLRFEGSKLFLDDVDLEVQNRGSIAARFALDLDAPDTVGFDTSFALMEGRLEEIGPFVALPADLATGSIDASGTLRGRVRPNANFIEELAGRVRADARDGKVETSLPLMFRLAKATEGYNPFAGENELQFETMGGSFVIDRGAISVQDFEIEGPLRVFARADIDTVAAPAEIRAVVGIFLFRKPNALLESLPLVRSFLPGSELGLIGTYFEVDGPIAEPDIEAMPLQSLMTSVPDVIKAPFKVLRQLFERPERDS